MNQTINDRIESIVNKDFGGNKSAFATTVGIAPPMMSSYLGKQRRSKPNIDMVVKIVRALNVDPWWLMTGEQSPATSIHTEGDNSPVNNSGSIEVIVGDAVLKERVGHLEELIGEKDQQIKLLKSILRKNNLLDD
ncbi:MAG: XRE family transcriptional regulator [Muribaculaceae bacterium]|nr:XRE family transcriptional regulator [Muribaculaceae bacterium]